MLYWYSLPVKYTLSSQGLSPNTVSDYVSHILIVVNKESGLIRIYNMQVLINNILKVMYL